jgi:hypothetical protein
MHRARVYHQITQFPSQCSSVAYQATSFVKSRAPGNGPRQEGTEPLTTYPPSLCKDPHSMPFWGSQTRIACLPLPRCKPDALGWLSVSICLVSLGLYEENNFSEAVGMTVVGYAWKSQGRRPPAAAAATEGARLPSWQFQGNPWQKYQP